MVIYSYKLIEHIDQEIDESIWHQMLYTQERVEGIYSNRSQRWNVPI